MTRRPNSDVPPHVVKAVTVLLVFTLCVSGLVAQIAWRASAAAAWRVLVQSLAEERVVDARLSGIPHGIRLRSADTQKSPLTGSPEVLSAAASLEKQTQFDPSPTTLRRAAIARLLINDVDTAVSLLEKAATMAPGDYALRSDLAAAYLSRAERRQTGVDLVRALDAAVRATTAAPDFGAAWFNQALALERLGVVDAAADAWRRAAVVDRDGWSQEASDRAIAVTQAPGRVELLARLQHIAPDDVDALETAAASDADLAGEIIERRWLRACVQATLAGDRAAAATCYANTRRVAFAIVQTTGDAAFADLADELSRCDARCADGWQKHLDAVDRWTAEDYTGARAQSALADAALASRPALSAIAAARVYLQTNIDRLNGNRTSAVARLEAMRAFAQQRHYWTIAGRIEWQSALAASESGSFGIAISRYLSASEYFARARNREGRATVEALVSQNYQFLDDLDQAWEHELRGLADLKHATAARRVPILSLAAILASASNLDAAALAFRAPLIRDAREQGSSARLVNRLAEESGVLTRLGLHDQARARVAEAAEHARTITDPALAALAQGLVQTWRGRLLVEESPEESIAALDQAVAIYRGRNDWYALPELQLDRGRAFVKAGRLADAETAFEEGIAIAEQQRKEGANDQARTGALSARWDLYAHLIALRLRTDESKALSLLHQMRAVNLGERLGGAAADASTPPPGTTFVEYAMLPAALHAWIWTTQGRRHVVIGTPIDTLTQQINDYRDAITRREEPRLLAARSHPIYQALIDPIAGEVAASERLVLVLDGPLHDLPFASLEDPVRHRFLVEDVSIVTTPSLNFQFHHGSGHPQATALAALVVGNPSRESAVQDRLPALPNADREARTIAALYAPSELAVGTDATREFFLAHVARTRVVHFAGHALISERRPEGSRLLFSASAEDPSGVLLASDVERLSLSGTKLVVLAACDTARGRLARGEGVVGLARSFLFAGVSSVVATLWPVDDRATALLFAAFHREWRNGADSSEALRAAQLELIRSGAPVADWGAALVVGRSVRELQEN